MYFIQNDHALKNFELRIIVTISIRTKVKRPFYESSKVFQSQVLKMKLDTMQSAAELYLFNILHPLSMCINPP